ncbi:tRNA (adenine(22)-N(1))-methyltransferase [Paenibacillus xylaniclasticus]|uniref:tRNA (adenine(22)-N(1))-methyltransferase n=1 Tax=Paenibacillus xylaniclasticus TaxID=588083 RepID=UPI00175EF34D|nr:MULTISPECIES: class I SAM-dependent methyltransferase [Paenibacillus]GFN30356.1 tRNA (adenine(22)-N(1))-methyltransferase [Paenibacillus curdlanolyticus]
MNVKIKLSDRLSMIAELVQDGARIADIGSDHALLPVYLVSAGKCPSAIAGELNKGPFEAACRQVNAAGLNDKVQVRRGDGLSVVQAGEVDIITIAGMGGQLIATILEEGYKAGKLEGVRQLVLQPNVGEDAVRRWLTAHDWLLTDERILEEDGKIYEIIAATSVDDAAERNAQLYRDTNVPSAAEGVDAVHLLYRFGPYLLQQPNEVFFRKWESEIRKMKRILEQMEQSETEEAADRAEQFRAEMRRMEEVLECLLKDKR